MRMDQQRGVNGDHRVPGPPYITSRNSGQEYCSSGSVASGFPVLRSGSLYPWSGAPRCPRCQHVAKSVLDHSTQRASGFPGMTLGPRRRFIVDVQRRLHRPISPMSFGMGKADNPSTHVSTQEGGAPHGDESATKRSIPIPRRTAAIESLRMAIEATTLGVDCQERRGSMHRRNEAGVMPRKARGPVGCRKKVSLKPTGKHSGYQWT